METIESTPKNGSRDFAPRRRKATGEADLEYPRGKAGCKVEIGIRNCEPEYFIALPCAS